MSKKILFLCEDIWSMGEKKGVSSLYRLIQTVKYEFEVAVLQPVPQNFYVKNRYIQYLLNMLFYIRNNIKYIILGIRQKNKPDVIYASSSLPSFAAYFLSKYYDIPYLQRLYGTFLFHKLGNKIELLKNYQEVISFLLPANKYIITDDGTYGDRVAEYFGISEKKIFFEKNGVDKLALEDKALFRREIRKEFNIPENALVAISVSRLVGWKRVDRSIKAFNKISDKDIFLIIVGDGEEREACEALKDNLNILFVGALTGEKVREFMLASDIFVSMYDLSNLGNPLLEAMSAGLAIITLDNGNTKDVYDGNNMILLEYKSEEEIVSSLTKTILWLKANLEEKVLLQQSANEYAQVNLLTWEERINKEFKEILYWSNKCE